MGADIGAARLVMDADGFAGSGIGDDGEDLLPLAGFVLRSYAAMDADRDLAASAECREGGAFGGDGKAGGGVVEKGDRGDGFRVVFAGLDAERALAGGGTEIFRLEALANPFGFFEAVESGGGEQDRVDLAFGKLAQAGVDVAAKFDGLNVGPERLEVARGGAGCWCRRRAPCGSARKAVILRPRRAHRADRHAAALPRA